ncbi:MAG: hypothetical protein JNJ90_02330 [Saprospiraceae bacterium]|jgi:hypothetical protein|nr:hypothetical protein [Saprospiraceae bacterium]
MNAPKLLPVLFALILATFTACNSGNQSAPEKSNPADAPASPQAEVPKPEVYLYCTFYDAVLLRETPDLKGKVVTKLPMCEFLEGTGEGSKQKFDATLGGIVWREPFLKVMHLTPEQKSGWVFGGAVEPVYAGPRAGSPNLGDLANFGSHLAKLDLKNLDSGEKAWVYVRQHHTATTGALADAIYLMLERFLHRMEVENNLYELTEKMNWSDEDLNRVYENKYDMGKSPVTKTLDAAGFRLATAEGMIFPVVDRKKLLDFFGKNVTPGMKQYIEQNWIELAEPSMSDAHIAIELEQLADRGIFWENFNKTNPWFVRKDETAEHEAWVRLSMINGLIFNEETGEAYPEYVKVWAYIQQKYPDSQLGKDVAAFTRLLAAEGNKKTQKVADFQDEYAQKYNGETE